MAFLFDIIFINSFCAASSGDAKSETSFQLNKI